MAFLVAPALPRNATRARVTMVTTEEPSTKLVTSSERAARLPWKESICGPEFDLLFMPFAEHQMKVMREHFPDAEDVPFPEELSFQSATRRVCI